MQYDFPRYLSAKKTVDDRALNLRVWQRLVGEVQRLYPGGAARRASGLRLLELGAGTGTMLERMLEWQLLTRGAYLGLDHAKENIDIARQRLPEWAAHLGYRVTPVRAAGFRLEGDPGRIEADFEALDVFEFVLRADRQPAWDFLVAHAFLDLVDLPSALPAFLSLLRPGGLFYFTLNFDGMSVLEPTIDPSLDAKILALYHRSMDERMVAGRRAGESRTGRHLFTQLRDCGAEVLEAGSSDWVVYPHGGSYPGDEAYFLHFIIHFFEQSLRGHPDLEGDVFERWAATRHAQVEAGELVFIAHQLDFIGKVPG